MKSNKIKSLLLIIFPFIFLAPFTLQLLDPGNDFELYYFTYKKYIFELLKVGHLPLWSPGEAAGYSLIFNPLTQFFYLPSWIYYLISFFIGDLSKYSFLIYTISAISIFNIGLFKFLKTFDINIRIVITAVLIVSISLKITELLRFPNALHAMAWFPWVLYGINSILIKNKPFKNFLIIFFSSFMIFTAGYPYYIIYAFILFSIYVIFLIISSKKNILFNENKFPLISNKKLLFRVSLPAICSAILFSPIYFKISELMSITRDRNISDINFSFHGSSNLTDQIGSWIFPPFSMAEGWYYFGSAPIFVLISVVIFTFLFRGVVTKDKIQLKIIAIFFIVLFLINYQFSNSEGSLIFKYVWHMLEPIQNFRFWIRINIILLPIFALVLALSLQNLINVINNSENNEINKINSVMVLALFLILSTQIYFINFSDYTNFYWDTWQLKRINTVLSALPPFFSNIVGLYKNYIYSIFFIIIFIFLIIILNFKFLRLKFKKNSNYFLFVILFLTCGEMFFLSNIQWAIPHNYYENGFEKLSLKKNYNSPNNQADQDLINAFKEKRVSMQKSGTKDFHGNTYYRHNKKFNINYINHWGNNNHTLLFDIYFRNNGLIKEDLDLNTQAVVKYFYGMDKHKKKFFFSDKIIHNNILNFVNDSKKNEKNSNVSFEVVKYTGDELIIKIFSNKSGWISFIDTWDPNWVVIVNEKQKKLDKLFEAYKSVKIESGVSIIKFEYRPFNLNFKNLF